MSAGYRSDHTTSVGLREHGWTDAAIKRFLGEPDKRVPNPHYKSGPEMKLYAVARVLEIEKAPAWQEWLAASASRKRGAQTAVETKRVKLIEYAEAMRITVPEMPRDKVTALACRHYNMRSRDDDMPADKNSDEAFLERISVNYLRHQMSSYERQLMAVYGKVGVEEGVRIIRRKVYAAIAAAYPYFDGECKRQKEYRESFGASR